MQSVTLNKIFNPAFKISPDSIRFIVSIETSEETDFLIQSFYYDYDFQWVQRQIMQSDEYAHFN